MKYMKTDTLKQNQTQIACLFQWMHDRKWRFQVEVIWKDRDAARWLTWRRSWRFEVTVVVTHCMHKDCRATTMAGLCWSPRHFKHTAAWFRCQVSISLTGEPRTQLRSPQRLQPAHTPARSPGPGREQHCLCPACPSRRFRSRCR